MPQNSAEFILNTLRETFSVFRGGVPLAIGTHKAILASLPTLEDQQVRTALKIHTRSTRYLKAIANGDTRFDLDGNPAGEITAEQKQVAIDALKARFKQGAERHRAQKEIARKSQVAVARQAKLEELATKFNRR